MKVERKTVEPTFETIVITIESKDEAEIMYAMLNCSTHGKLVEYMESIGMGKLVKGTESIRHVMWKTFDAVFQGI